MDDKNNLDKEIELRSEELQEVMGSTPSWILRRGILLLFLIVALLLTGGWKFRFPDIISTQMTLTASAPATSIVAKTSGKITALKIHDLQEVEVGETLGIIENNADYEDILQIEAELDSLSANLHTYKPYYLKISTPRLGQLQSLFSSFVLNLDSYNKFIELNYYPRKIESTQKLIEANKHQYANTLKQFDIVSRQYDIAKRIYERDSYLKEKNLISEEENDKALGQLLQSESSFNNMKSAIENHKIQELQMYETLADLEQQYAEKRSSLLSSMNNTINQLKTDIQSWKMSYLLISPIRGKVSFFKYWSVNQNVSAGDVVFTVVPLTNSGLLGKALLPVERSGKVKAGQQVNIRFVNYPDQEFGMVKGKVGKISLIPVDGFYAVDILFPDGLKTSYGKELPLSHEMTANADIVTENSRLLEQLFLPLKKAIKSNIQ